MESLFSCRNCIHNGVQTLAVGPGPGFCLKFNSVIREPNATTCKYLHRKDLPRFAVSEGLSEHAAEFASCSGIAHLATRKPIERVAYSERYYWERKQFSPLLHALAQYAKTTRHWIMVQVFAGSVDGLRAVAHASLFRRYLDTCGKWQSSWRLVLALIQELDSEPLFTTEMLASPTGASVPSDDNAARADALWDVFFLRLSALQEFGWHSGLEDMRWLSDSLNGSLTAFDWPALKHDLSKMRPVLTKAVIGLAKKENVYFGQADEGLASADMDEA